MNSNFKEWLSVMKKNRKKLYISLFFLLVSLTLYGLSGDYVTEKIDTAYSHDLILDNFGPYNFGFIFVWLFILVILMVLFYPLIFKPLELHYVLNMFSFFIIMRSGFVILTHLRPPPDSIQGIFPHYFNFLIFSNDLFFSGHTGLPFLGFLVFRKHHKWLGYFMLASSVILGMSALLMHVHYSIDVASAYFITYCIYLIGNRYFKI